jgi:hypothetical protein
MQNVFCHLTLTLVVYVRLGQFWLIQATARFVGLVTRHGIGFEKIRRTGVGHVVGRQSTDSFRTQATHFIPTEAKIRYRKKGTKDKGFKSQSREPQINL